MRIALLFAFLIPIPALANGDGCGKKLRATTALGELCLPKDFIPFLVTPRLLIGRKVGEEGEYWMRIVARDTLKVVGCIAIRVEGNTAQIPIYMDRLFKGDPPNAYSMAIRPGRLREGFATEAKQAAIDYVFGQLPVTTIYGRVLSDNIASLALHAKLGYEVVPLSEVPPVFRIAPWNAAGPITYIRLRDPNAK